MSEHPGEVTPWRLSLGDIRSPSRRLLTAVTGAGAGGAVVALTDPGTAWLPPLILLAGAIAGIMASWSP